MAICYVLGCPSHSATHNDVLFFTLPPISVERPDPLKTERRKKWLRALNGTGWPKNSLENVRVCSEHFITGKPALPEEVDHPDWIPRLKMPSRKDGKRFQFPEVTSSVQPEEFNQSLDKIITDTPEIKEEFDVPEYIIFNETAVKPKLPPANENLPICDANGYYINDHDYLPSPFTRTDVNEQRHATACLQDHDYTFLSAHTCSKENLQFFCNICQKNHEDFYSFNRHMMDHTTQNDVTCPICSQIFLTTSCLNNHVVTHSSMCDACGCLVPTVQLAAHQGLKPSNFAPSTTPKDNEKVYFCIVCAQAFPVMWEYLDHCVKVHNEKLDGKKLLYSCKKCSELFVLHDHLKEHSKGCGLPLRKILPKRKVRSRSVNV